jgi:hypothetical protein
MHYVVRYTVLCINLHYHGLDNYLMYNVTWHEPGSSNTMEPYANVYHLDALSVYEQRLESSTHGCLQCIVSQKAFVWNRYIEYFLIIFLPRIATYTMQTCPMYNFVSCTKSLRSGQRLKGSRVHTPRHSASVYGDDMWGFMFNYIKYSCFKIVFQLHRGSPANSLLNPATTDGPTSVSFEICTNCQISNFRLSCHMDVTTYHTSPGNGNHAGFT